MTGQPSRATAGSTLRTFFGAWQGWFILLVIASQLLLPLHYYLARRDRHDERFAWRMFSPMRMAQCRPVFKVDDKPAPVGEMFHEAWLEIAKRGRFRVIEAMAAELCARNPGSAVTVLLTCTYVDRAEPVQYGGWNMCNVPLL